MDDANINKGYSNFVIALLLLFPVVIGSVKIIGNLILLILVFMGIYILLKEKKSPFMVPELKLFSWITFSYFIVMLLSIVQNDGFIGELHHLGRKAHFLLAPLIGLAIYKVNLPLDRLLISLKVGLIIVGIITVYQSYIGILRPSGMFNANVFGDIAVVMFFLSIVRLYDNNTTMAILLTYISTSLGFYAIVVSGNRGSWIAFICLLIVYVVYSYKRFISTDKKRRLILILVWILALIIISISNKYLLNRINIAFEDTINWSINIHSLPGSSSEMNNLTSPGSSSQRLEMWFAGLEAAKDSPWIGYGYRNSTLAAQKYTEKDIKGYSHLHNEFITNLVSAGIIGLISVMALLLLPLRLFLQSIKDKGLFDYSLMGVLLCSGYGFIGLTHIAFGEEHVNAIYIFFLAILLPSVLQIRERL